MARLYISLFGTYRVTLDDRLLADFDSDKTRLLLAYLAAEAGKPHRRDHLVGLFWPDQPEAHARRSLSQAIYNLRKLLGEQRDHAGQGKPAASTTSQKYILTDASSVQLNPGSSFTVDAHRFIGLLTACQAHPHRYLEACPDCMQRLVDLFTLYKGDFLAGFSLKDSVPFEEWALVQREHFHRSALEAIYSLAISHENRGELQQALQVARRAVDIDPFWETGQRQLMQLLALDSQHSKAVAGYERYKQRLARELGVPPEKATQSLAERLNREAYDFISLGNLPPTAAPLVGRKDELAELHCYLNDPSCRLLTILGPGGCGKTRLALEIARSVQYSFPDGVFLISLSALDPSQSFVPVVAEALGFIFREQGNPRQQLLDYLSHKSLLLLMDSFEAVLAGANWVSETLRAAPAVKFLVTSRARLNIHDEQLFQLGSMPYPAPDEQGQASEFSAVQLFEQSARRIQPGFSLQAETIPGVIQICQQVQGMPLGILLAAAWMDLFTPVEIAEEISKNLDFLSSSWQDIPERQRSLHATFDYSWNLLSQEEQRFFTALAVFHGSFSMQAVRWVAGDSARLLQSLVDKCLVSPTAAGRYHVHDLVHQFALKRLETDPDYSSEAHTRHSRFYMEALADWGKDLKHARQREALEAMDLEVENLRAAWRWAVEIQDWLGISSGLEGMSWYADLRFRFQEGERACRTALQVIPAQSFNHLVSALTVWQAHFLRRLVQTEDARQILQGELVHLEALQMQGSDLRFEQAQVLFELGELNLDSDRDIARSYYQQSLDIFQEIGDGENTAKVLSLVGEVVHHAGEYELAGRLLAQALPLLQAAGEPRRLAHNLRWLGFNEIRQGRIDQGEPYIRQAIEVRKQIGDLSGAAQSQDDYATVLGWRGRYQEAKELLEQCLPLYEELGMHAKVAWVFSLLGIMSSALGQYDAARQAALRCVQFASQMNFPRELALGYNTLGQADLADQKFADAHQYFLHALQVERSIPQSDELAYVLAHLALAEAGFDQLDQALHHLCDALEITLSTRGMFSANFCLPAAAFMLSRLGLVKKAIEVQSMMLRYPAVANAPFYQAIAWRYVADTAAGLPPEAVQQAQERGRQRDLFGTAEELLREFSSFLEGVKSS